MFLLFESFFEWTPSNCATRTGTSTFLGDKWLATTEPFSEIIRQTRTSQHVCNTNLTLSRKHNAPETKRIFKWVRCTELLWNWELRAAETLLERIANWTAEKRGRGVVLEECTKEEEKSRICDCLIGWLLLDCCAKWWSIYFRSTHTSLIQSTIFYVLLWWIVHFVQRMVKNAEHRVSDMSIIREDLRMLLAKNIYLLGQCTSMLFWWRIDKRSLSSHNFSKIKHRKWLRLIINCKDLLRTLRKQFVCAVPAEFRAWHTYSPSSSGKVSLIRKMQTPSSKMRV